MGNTGQFAAVATVSSLASPEAAPLMSMPGSAFATPISLQSQTLTHKVPPRGFESLANAVTSVRATDPHLSSSSASSSSENFNFAVFAIGAMGTSMLSAERNSRRVPSGRQPLGSSARALAGSPAGRQQEQQIQVARAVRSFRRMLLPFLAVAALTFGGGAAWAAGAPAAAAAEAAKPHLGQRLAMALRSAAWGLPDWAILTILSAMPLVELRGGVPAGLWMGLPVQQVMFFCILGNMLPIPLILFALRLPTVKSLLSPVLKRAEKKTRAIGAHDRWVGVAAFVGVPLPGTGAWTGAMVAYLLGMEIREACTSVLTGVCVASCIMASLTLAGWYGCAAAAILCVVALFSRSMSRLKGASAPQPSTDATASSS